MIKESITKLILEMQEVIEEYPVIDIQEVLNIFAIDATNNLTKQMKRVANDR